MEYYVREYTEQHYLHAAKSYLDRAANNGEKGKQIADTLKKLEQNWDSIHFGELKVVTNDNQHVFEIQIYFNGLNPDNVEVELFSNDIDGEASIVQIMNRGQNLEGESNAYLYHASVSLHRLASDFTARAIPFIPSVSVPLEISKITWQH